MFQGGSVVLSNSMSSMEQRKFRHLSGSSNTSTDSLPHANGMHYQKAPGSEREDPQVSDFIVCTYVCIIISVRFPFYVAHN